MTKILTEHEAWLWLANVWKSPDIPVRGDVWVEVGRWHSKCLCGSLDKLRGLERISQATYEAMSERMKANALLYANGRPRTSYWWPTTTEGASGRAEFCTKMAAQCVPEEPAGMEPFQSEHAVWVWLAEQWKNGRVVPEYSCGNYGDYWIAIPCRKGYSLHSRCLCGAIGQLYLQEWISWAIREAMGARLRANLSPLSEGQFAWPPDKAGAEKRSEFCAKMAELSEVVESAPGNGLVATN